MTNGASLECDQVIIKHDYVWIKQCRFTGAYRSHAPAWKRGFRRSSVSHVATRHYGGHLRAAGTALDAFPRWSVGTIEKNTSHREHRVHGEEITATACPLCSLWL